MRIFVATIVVLSSVGLGGCNQHETQQVANLGIQHLTQQELEASAWDKTPAEVRANLGPPTAIRRREDGQWWFYNHLQIRYDDGNVMCPQIHFEGDKWVSIGYTEPDQVESFMNDEHWLSDN